MAEVGIKELLEAGVHFGHQTRRWNPRMRRYIHGEREGIHVIDLLQTEELLQAATEFATDIARKGGVIEGFLLRGNPRLAPGAQYLCIAVQCFFGCYAQNYANHRKANSEPWTSVRGEHSINPLTLLPPSLAQT